MQRKSMFCTCLAACLVTLAPAFAQEGHPLTGSWHGAWTTASGQRTPVFIFMKWDSKNIIATINPGPKAIPIKVATMDPTNWTVHFEADTKDASGSPVHIVIDGKLADLGSYHRTISGTWTQGAEKGDFKITRD
ncbi:MAG TPA: hypothetical protein VFW83_04455 [Bryobacteraceae bacterium]|nr:hypothetical protein [Bryobacteraceae bacterium]